MTVHDYATNPTGSWGDAMPTENTITRLQRPEVGATPDEAAALAGQLDEAHVLAVSDDILRQAVVAYRDAGKPREEAKAVALVAEQATVDAYDPSIHTVDEVLGYVDEEPSRAPVVLAAEKTGKNRGSVVSVLEGLAE